MGSRKHKGSPRAEWSRCFYHAETELTLLEDTDSDGVADLYLSVADGFDTLASIMNSLTVPSSIREERCSSRRASAHPTHEAKSSATGQMSSALGYRGWMMKVDGEVAFRLSHLVFDRLPVSE